MIKKKTKKNNKILITLCAMFIAIASVFSFISFNKTDDLVVKADTVETSGYLFNGSPLLIPVTFDHSTANQPSPNNIIDFSLFTASFSVNDLGYLSWFKFNFNGPLKRFSNHTDMTYDLSDPSISDCYIADNFFTSATYNSSGDYYYNWYVQEVHVNATTTNYVHTQLLVKSPYDIIDGNYYWKFGKPIKVLIDGTTSFGGVCTKFEYTDADDNWLSFRVYYSKFSSGSYAAFDLDSRVYYFSDSLNLTDNQYYEQGYSAGQTAGYNNGYNVGKDEGYNNGYNVGNNVGYNNGYSAGLEDSNNYTFLSLLSATIDAPIKYFQSLFNFELLGVNLQGFLTGLFTLCVIVTIIKMVL